MTAPEFVHLHVHGEYSLREGALRMADAVAAAAEWGMPALALTDTDALYGAIPFYRAALAAGVRPILGVQLNIARDTDAEAAAERRPAGPPVDKAVLLAEDLIGYEHLVALVTQAQSRERSPFVTFSELGAASAGLIALVGGGESLPLRQFSAGHEQDAEAWLHAWHDTWPRDSLFVDVQDHQLQEERQGLPRLVRWARDQSIALVATNDVHYLRRSDAPVQQVLAQIESGSQGRVLSGDRYEFAAPEEMAHRFAKLPEAITNTLLVAERCHLQLPQGQLLLPHYPTTGGEPSDVVLRRAAEAGVRQRYRRPDQVVLDRLAYELDVIIRLGFADYFLVVADFVRFAHRQGISTGPGRGSAAGSLVAYALRITDVDPIRHGLLFERFLNPARVNWPDIDIDFEFERRPEVIRYVVERYGVQHVAQIGTFGTLAARAAIRDAGRVLGTDPTLIDRVAKLIPGQPGVTLATARAEVGPIADVLQESLPARQLWETASAIEGFPRHTSIHAAGVVISPQPLSTRVPVQPGVDGTPVTQYAMDAVEYLGLLKMDFLGLRTLSLIDACLASVERRTGRKLSWRAVPEDDAATFTMLSRGETDGCFQLESAGVRRVLRDLKPSRLEDLIAVISLYRPGPMENIPAFIAGRHGRAPVRYPHPDLEPILRDTYGVIVYQEQIMQIASRMAGFSLGEADLLRRAVSKKKREVLDAERSRFVSGCLAAGYEEPVAQEVYDLIVRFADYGFNRSHAAAYAVLCYRTAYLRAHHLPDFLAALLSLHAGVDAKAAVFAADARRHTIAILPPCVTRSGSAYAAESDTAIRSGLLAVRNVGRSAVDAILAARAEAPFTSLVDFLRRVNPRACNRKAVESLLAAGALQAFLPDGAAPAVAAQLLEEAYLESGAGPHEGLGLSFAGSGAGAGSRPRRVVGPGSGGVQGLYIRMPEDRAQVDRIRDVLRAHPGEVPVALLTGQHRARLLPDKWAVAVTPELVGELEEWVGLGNARIGSLPTQARRRTEQPSATPDEWQ